MKEAGKQHHFFAYLSRMKHIKRWGLMRNTETENIKEHSMAMGLFHETGEIMTGDLPTPVKYYNQSIQKAYQEIEQMAVSRAMDMLPEELKPAYQPLIEHENDEDYRFVKYADKLCAYIKCIEEVKTGNAEFQQAKCKIAEQIAQMEEPAVLYFIEHFLPSFGLTIDELNK